MENVFLNQRVKLVLSARAAQGWSLIHSYLAISILIAGVGLSSGSFSAESSPDQISYTIDLTVKTASGLPDQLSGTFSIRNWEPKNNKYCLFLPYNWGAYGSDRGSIKRFNDITSQKGLPVFSGGGTNLSVEQPIKIEATDINHTVRLIVPPGWSSGEVFTFTLESTVPKLPDSNPNEVFFDGAIPIPIECSEDSEPSLTSPEPIAFEGTITTPTGWHYIGSGRLESNNKVEISTKNRSFAFTLTRGLKRNAIRVGNVPIDILYNTEEFKEVADTISKALPLLEQYLGPYPFSSLNIVETDELQRYSIPGIIALNRPRQAFANKIQKDWLNWMHWTAVSQLARQWFGASMNTNSDNDWLLSGIVEFLTLEILTQIPEEFDLFQADSAGHRYVSFNYLQMSEFTAASLRRLAPYTALTNSSLKSLEGADTQHGLAYIRQAFALRQIKSITGKPQFSSFLRAFFAQYENKSVTPEDFYKFIYKLPSPFNSNTREEIAKSLMRWWTDYGWPDFAIKSFDVSEKSGSYDSNVTVAQNGSIDFAPIIEVTDDRGGNDRKRASRNNEGLWQANFRTSFKPEKTIVDPDHETFDSDRFNNHTGMSGFIFFPGNGDTVHDDKYSIVWFPYGYRLPGEPVTIGVGSAIFKYVQSGILARVEHAPSTNQWAYQFRQLYSVPDWAIKGELSVNYGFENDRTTELNAIRSPIFNSPSVVLSGQLKVRHKDHPGDADQTHQTFAANLTFKPKGQPDFFNYNVLTEGEVSPEQGRGFSYKRYHGLIVSGLKLSERISIGLRGFRGKTLYEGVPPATAFYRPNEIKEANLKVDIQNLDRSADLVSWEAGLTLPFYAPLPKDSLILTRQIQWRLYYDWGKAYDLNYEYHSHGIGVVMPLGGDVSGVGSLAVTRFTFLAILNSAAGPDSKKRPGFVFDITGEL